MPLLVVGSVALDSVETPTQRRDDVLGGSAVFFSYAASYFSPVRLVGVVGEDWPAEHTALLRKRGIDTSGLHIVKGGKTFRWRGKYQPNMNDRETLEVHLNVFGKFDPVLPAEFRRSKFLFLANGSPVIQLKVLDQVPDAVLTVADTMDLWINIQRDELMRLFKRIDGLVLNDSEAQLLTGDENLVRAGKQSGNWARSSWSSRKASTGRCSSASTKPTSCPPIPRPTSSIRPAPATASPAA